MVSPQAAVWSGRVKIKIRQEKTETLADLGSNAGKTD
jgi:hypothetical protein